MVKLWSNSPKVTKKHSGRPPKKKNPMAGPPICGTALWPQFPESHARLNGLDEPRVARKTGEDGGFSKGFYGKFNRDSMDLG